MIFSFIFKNLLTFTHSLQCNDLSLDITVKECFSFSHLLIEMRMMCRCSPCQTSAWWCWRSPSPTCPLTPWTLMKMEMTHMPLSCSSPSQTLCPMLAPGSRHRYELLELRLYSRKIPFWISVFADFILLTCVNIDEMPSEHEWLPSWMWPWEPYETKY